MSSCHGVGVIFQADTVPFSPSSPGQSTATQKCGQQCCGSCTRAVTVPQCWALVRLHLENVVSNFGSLTIWH